MNNVHSQKSSSDRFIPRRAMINIDMAYYAIHWKTPKKFEFKIEKDYFNLQKESKNLRKYRELISDSLMLPDVRILRFSSPSLRNSPIPYHLEEHLWPVVPRKQPLLDQPIAILDLPELDTRIDAHVVDWGKKGYVATIYNSEVHLWHPEKKLKRQVTMTGQNVRQCVRWNKTGTLFAMSVGSGTCAIANCDLRKTIAQISCICPQGHCFIKAIDWTKDDLLVTACSRSWLLVSSQTGRRVSMYDMGINHRIISIKLSCNESFLVTSTLEGVVTIWRFPQLQPISYMKDRMPVKAIDWHPWKENLIALGTTKSICLFNVTSFKVVGEQRHLNKNCFVDNLTFNPISAELVVAYYSSNQENGLIHWIVMETFDKIVDGITFNSGRIPYLLWDSTGARLATGSIDENLCIWNFFGKEHKKHLKHKKVKYLSTDPLKTVSMLGWTIR